MQNTELQSAAADAAGNSSEESKGEGASSSSSNSTHTAAAGDPQALGALARAMRTQCAQLIGHTLVLLRNIAEACRAALKARGALLLPTGGSASGGAGGSAAAADLYDCLKGADGIDCILPADLLALVKKHCGVNFNSSNNSCGKMFEMNSLISAVREKSSVTFPAEDQTQSSLSSFKFSHNLSIADYSGASAATTTTSTRRLDRGDQSLLSCLLFVGRVSWLFKIRGNFLDYALLHNTATSPTSAAAAISRTLGGSNSGTGLASASMDGGGGATNAVTTVGGSNTGSTNSSKEDQFRSAFEIADTNGDGVLTYTEALEVSKAAYLLNVLVTCAAVRCN